MRFFTKKNFLYKMIICLCIFFAIMNCLGTKKVYAEGGVGGVLISPICNLLLGIGDGIMNILQNSIMGTEATLPVDNSDESWYETLGAFVVAIVVAVAVVVLCVVTMGGFAAVLAAITPFLIKTLLVVGVLYMTGLGDGVMAMVSAVSSALFSDTIVLPTYSIGPEEIFSGKILLFDPNIFNPKTVYVEYDILDEEGNNIGHEEATLERWNAMDRSGKVATGYYYEESDGTRVQTSVNHSAYELRDIIAKWYYIIRTIALIGSMLILLYIGIKIIISGVAEEKAKYKQMLADWVIGLCLIFMMHYIMVFAHSIVENITKIFSNSFELQNQVAVIAGNMGDDGEELNSSFVEAIEALEESSGKEYLKDGSVFWPTNLMGRLRVQAQAQDSAGEYVGYAIANFVLVIYTLTFSITYIKRLIYLLFLTFIAPLVALTYPIDKIHDGKAQAFNLWLREYIFNLMIQPFHLVLYTVFVSMALEMAGTNIIYTLVVLGFMMPAEKFLRNMFGFNKASTPGMLGGAAGAAVAMSAVNALGRFAKGGNNGGKKQGDKGSEKEGAGKLRTADSKHSQQALFEGLTGRDSNGGEKEANNQADDSESGESAKEKQRQRALDKYNNEGGKQNSEGHYFNPWTDEYDENYDPTADKAYNGIEDNETTNANLDTGAKEEMLIESSKVTSVPKLDSSMEQTALPEKKDGRIKRTLRAEGRALKRLGISTLKAAPGAILKASAKVAAGATFGAVGLATGIASGDPNKAFQNTLASTTAGVAVSTGVINRLPKSNPQAKEQWKKDYYGADYKEHQREEQDKAFAKDSETRAMYKEQLGLKSSKEVDQAMEEANQYRAFGVNDNSIIIKAMKSKKGSSDKRDDRERIAAAKLAENSKTEKDLQTNMKRFKEVPGMTEKQAKKMEAFVREINNL